MVDDEVVEELQDAIADIQDGDPDSLSLYDDGRGHFIINSDAEDQDVDDIDAALEQAGYERDGIVDVPGMVQQDVVPTDGDA